MTDTLFKTLLQYGDDSLILAQRLCEWSGKAPTIEVDLSLSNVALDLLGQATYLLDYAGSIEGKGRDGDRLAFHRGESAFLNCLLVEQPNLDFGATMARQLLFSLYSELAFEALQSSSDVQLAAIAEKASKEVRYHVEMASEWVIRLGDGTAESHERMVDGFDWHWRFLDDLFAADDDQSSLVLQGVVPDRQALRATFDRRLGAVLDAAILPRPAAVWQITGGREGRHSEHLGPLLAEVQVLPRAMPEASW
jgi:ring-1,2-phenylacetyl-CoA epoxidase subunit PaaC